MNRVGWFGLDPSPSTMEQVVGFCENGNERSPSVRLCSTVRVLPASRVSEIQIFWREKNYIQLNNRYIIAAEL